MAGKYDKPDDAWWDDDYSNGNARWEAIKGISAYELVPVSYTHLDVYKRQVLAHSCQYDSHSA